MCSQREGAQIEALRLKRAAPKGKTCLFFVYSCKFVYCLFYNLGLSYTRRVP